MTLFLDDNGCREKLFPFTHTRHLSDIRLGILTLRQKWELLTGLVVQTDIKQKANDAVTIPANIIPDKLMASQLLNALNKHEFNILANDTNSLQYPWDICRLNDAAIRNDYEWITDKRRSASVSATNHCINPGQIFIEEGVQMEHCIINASTGPVYIGKNAIIMEGSMIRGPFSAGESSVVKMGTKIYGASSIGPQCVVGGEIKNSIMFGYSNKAHDGYLGDSVIGEWCNIGAGSSNSNVKNTGGAVKICIDKNATALSAGNKSGLFMGDYSRCAINTSFNTGTVIGVCCNIFGEMPAKYVHQFSWGNEKYIFEKVLIDIENWKKMKGHRLSITEIGMLKKLYSEL